MKINSVIDVQVTTDVANFAAEPVTLDEVKRHLNLLFDTSGSYVFNDDDTYLTELVSECRESLEQALGVSMAVKTYKAILQNECGGIEVPYGPMGTVTTVKDIDGVVLVAADSYILRGNQFQWFESPVSCYIEVVYTAGYTATTIPKGLKRALLEEIAFRYNNRGDTNPGLSEGAMNLAARYSRKSLVV